MSDGIGPGSKVKDTLFKLDVLFRAWAFPIGVNPLVSCDLQTTNTWTCTNSFSLFLTKLCYTNTGRSGRWLCPVICMLPVNSLHYAKHCKNVFLVTVSMAAWQQCMSRPLNTRACDNPVTPPGFPPHTHTHVLWVPFALLNAILLLLCFVALAPKTTTTPWNALLVRAEQNTVVSLNWAPSECNSWVPVWCFTSPHTEVYSLQWPFGKITIC